MKDKKDIQSFDISDKSACIVGIGGLGCNIAVHLAGAGIGKLYICDFDTVSQSNLNRQFLYTESDTGKSKVFCAKEWLCRYSPQSEIKAFKKKIRCVEDMNFAKNCDIIILAADNPQTRKTVQDFCFEKKLPLVCGVIDGFYGMSYLYIPDVTPCLSCASLTEKAEVHSNVSPVAGIIGSLEAIDAVRYLLTKDQSLGGVLTVYDEGNFDKLTIRPAKECEKCKNIK